jgi:asparagine synthase (glutamine-hydrolysing)
MCGIFGFYLSDSAQSFDHQRTLKSMGDAIRHRGPDDDGFVLDGPVGLGMRRLSIIDLKTGRQPIHNEDGSLQIVFNGEIYNYRELAQELLDRGHTFYTSSDTEVILHLFEEYGVQCVQRLRGMFAFALWDMRNRTLFLGRDRLGIKPLYYSHTLSGLIFGSEVKSILRFPQFDREIDPEGLLAYLRYGYVPDPLSIFQNVRKLPPGHFLLMRNGGPIEVRPYWDPVRFFEVPSRHRSEQAWLEELRWRLAEAVRLHLVSDVPVGAFLSGGIDSSAVVGLMAAELGHSVKTFSIGFKEEAFNELPYARLVSQRFATEHHELIVGGESVDLIERIVEYFDEPFADTSAIPTYLVSRLAREHVKVILSGDGGDELFAGYDRYVVDHRRRYYDVISRLGISGPLQWMSDALPDGAPGKNYLFNVSLSRMERYVDSISHHTSHSLGQLLSGDLLAKLPHVQSDVFAQHVAQGESLDFPSRLQYFDMKTYLPGDILAKVDRMSMAHSIEARVPLLDHRLVEFVAAIPSRYKLRARETKYLFKRAMQEVVPLEILFRRKQGFGIPLDYWFHQGFRSYIRERLLEHDALQHGLFNRSYVEALWNVYIRTARPDYLNRLWALLVFEIWYRTFVGTR